MKAKSLDDLRQNEHSESESRLLRECQYLIMCDEIDQHDKFIRHQIAQYWEGRGFTRFLKKWILPNLTVLFVIIFIAGIILLSKSYSMSEKVLISAITSIVTIIIEYISRKFADKNH